MTKPKNESSPQVEVNIIQKPKCLIELEVKASKDLVSKAKEHAIKELKKEISLPGFRKGKAPDEMIVKKYPQELNQKWQKSIADLSFMEAHNSTKLPSLSSHSRITYNIKDFSLDEGANLVFSFETEPEIPDIDPKTFKLTKIKRHEITDIEVEEAIKQIRFFYAKWKTIDRPIAEGDYIIVDLESLETTPPLKVFADTRFEVSSRSMSHWMKELVLGSKTNDVLDGISKPDEDATEEEKQHFEEKKVRVTIKKIEEADLPEVDEDFAKKINAKDVEDMKEQIKKMLTDQANEKYEKEVHEQVNHFLINNYKFDLPDSLLFTEKESRKQNLMKDPSFKTKWNKLTSQEREKLEEEISQHAEEAISLYYLTKKIIKDADIKISNEDITKEALSILYKLGGKMPDIKNIPQDTYALALSRLVLRKAQDYILEHSSKN